MKKEQLKELLSEEIKTQIQDLSELDEKQARRKMDKENRLKDDALKEQQLQDENSVRERDELIRKEQLAEQVKDRYIRLGIAAAEIILPLMFYSKWMKKGFKFEETGTFTSTTFRGLFNRFKPTKK